MDTPSSDTTLTDADLDNPNWGYPLTRMRNELHAALGGGHGSVDDEQSDSDSDSDVDLVYDIDFESHITSLLSLTPSIPIAQLSTQHCKATKTPFTLLSLSPTSSHLLTHLTLNHPSLRVDPWNPAPYIICAVDRSSTSPNDETTTTIYLCIRHLIPYNVPPFKIVANWVDMFRQILEGLTFLHENGVVHGGFSSSAEEGVPLIMLDPSADPHSDSDCSEVALDRTRYPVRYYFTNLEKAQIVSPPSGLGALYSSTTTTTTTTTTATSPASSPTKTPAQEACRDDLASLGHFLHSLLENSGIPESPLRKKLVSLMRSMQQGTLRTADEARRLFEVLVGSVDGELLAASVEVGLGDGQGEVGRERKQSIVVDLGQDTDSMRKERKEKLKPRKPSLPFGLLAGRKESVSPPAIVSPISSTKKHPDPNQHNSDSDEDEKTLFDGNSDDSSSTSSLYKGKGKERRPWVFRSLSEGTHRHRHGKGRHRLMPSLDVGGVSGVGVEGVEEGVKAMGLGLGSEQV
ncbi:hypothetical protein VNI00_011322 [Paramarasmius palmivorus]|uniref:Protein kinase domain-containing protein n=1 Tax=Paramarasmius palmivorus TaxID=297713 RepID=A0AAW0CGM4_9AGAR